MQITKLGLYLEICSGQDDHRDCYFSSSMSTLQMSIRHCQHPTYTPKNSPMVNTENSLWPVVFIHQRLSGPDNDIK